MTRGHADEERNHASLANLYGSNAEQLHLRDKLSVDQELQLATVHAALALRAAIQDWSLTLREIDTRRRNGHG